MCSCSRIRGGSQVFDQGRLLCPSTLRAVGPGVIGVKARFRSKTLEASKKRDAFLKPEL